jgi:hypothetical protein
MADQRPGLQGTEEMSHDTNRIKEMKGSEGHNILKSIMMRLYNF